MSAHVVAGLGLVLTIVCAGCAYIGYRIGRSIERDASSTPVTLS